jgi:hypothetical protein
MYCASISKRLFLRYHYEQFFLANVVCIGPIARAACASLRRGCIIIIIRRYHPGYERVAHGADGVPVRQGHVAMSDMVEPSNKQWACISTARCSMP